MRDWWLRTLLVLQRPRPVFVALRDDSKQSLGDRSEPVLAIVLLVGIAGVLSTATAGRLLDDNDYDGLLVAVWAFIAGGIYGTFGYFAVGALLYARRRRRSARRAPIAARGTCSRSPACRSRCRSCSGRSSSPLFGEDVFRSGGSDSGAGGIVFAGSDVRVRRLGRRAARDRRARRARLDLAARAAAPAALAVVVPIVLGLALRSF